MVVLCAGDGPSRKSGQAAEGPRKKQVSSEVLTALVDLPNCIYAGDRRKKQASLTLLDARLQELRNRLQNKASKLSVPVCSSSTQTDFAENALDQTMEGPCRRASIGDGREDTALLALKEKMMSFLHGDGSPGRQVEELGQQRELTDSIIDSMEKKQQNLAKKISMLEHRNKLASITALSDWVTEETLSALEDKQKMAFPAQSCSEEMLKIAEFWMENNCDYYINKIIHTLRQVAAFEILRFVHKRLTSHMISHIYERSNQLAANAGQIKRSYLKMFGLGADAAQEGGLSLRQTVSATDFVRADQLCNKHGANPGVASCFFEGTSYAELLEFVEEQKEKGRRVKEVFMSALKEAERRLLKEAEKEGYRGEDVGDIRWQMSGFKAMEKRFNRYYSNACQKRLPNYCVELQGKETKDMVEEIRKLTLEGDLGMLERPSKIIRLGCFFLERQRVRNDSLTANLGTVVHDHELDIHSD